MRNGREPFVHEIIIYERKKERKKRSSLKYHAGTYMACYTESLRESKEKSERNTQVKDKQHRAIHIIMTKRRTKK
jgi:hypothetical protein